MIITSGTSVGLFLIFACLLNTRDEVILPPPYYPCYPNFIKVLKGVPIFVELEEKDGFWYFPDKIKEKISKKTKAILVNSPSNPISKSPDGAFYILANATKFSKNSFKLAIKY